VRYKSGKYTIERPLHVGAALAGRLSDLEAPLSHYGEPLGEAFQLRDDILGTFGDSAKTGKPVGDDLREGKPTPMLAIANERANKHQQLTLERVGAPDLSIEEIGELQSVFIATEALAEVERSIHELTEQALAALAHTNLTPKALDALHDLAVYVGARDI
jgi:geranylgeranyl diphosphate synthase type I